MRPRIILLPALIAFLVGASPAHAWTWPADGPVLQPFALGADPYAGGQHRGVDIAGASGSAVRAPAAGTVTFSGTVPGGGRTLTIQTSDGYAVTLLHLGALGVGRGASVAEGARVGVLGASGAVEHPAPYVHLGIRVASDPNGYVDPLSLLPAHAPTAASPEPEPPPVESAPAGQPPPAAPEGSAAQPAESPAPTEVAAPVSAPAPAAGASTSVGDGHASVATSGPSSAPSTSQARSGKADARAAVARASGPEDPRRAVADERARKPLGTEASANTGAGVPTGAAVQLHVREPSAAVPASDVEARRGLLAIARGSTGSSGPPGLAAAALAVALVALALATLGSAVLRRARAKTDPVPQRVETPAADPLDRAEAWKEARSPLLALDDEAAGFERCAKRPGVAQSDMRLVPSENKVALLQALDRVPDVRRIDRERPPRDEDAADLGQHLRERLVLEVLDQVGRDRLVEGGVAKRQLAHVRSLEPQLGKQPPRGLDGVRFGVDSDDVGPERGEKMGHGAACRAEVEDALAWRRLREVSNGCKPKARPRRLVEVRPRHVRREGLVVLRRRPPDEAEPHVESMRKTA